MMYADLKNIIENTPDDYYRKDFQSSLYLVASNTPQRTSTLVNVKLGEIFVNKDKGRLIINVSKHSSIFDWTLSPQISVFFQNSKSRLKYIL